MIDNATSHQSPKDVYLTTLKHIDLFNHLEREVAVLIDDDGQPWGEILHVCLSQKTLEEQIARFKRRVATFPLGLVIDFLLKHNRQQLNLYGFSLGNYGITREEFEKIAYEIDTFCLIWSCYKNKLSQSEVFEKLKTRTLYYLGSPILKPDNSTFNFDVENHDGYEFIKLFISKDSALQQNYHNRQPVPVNLGQFKLLVEGKYGLSIEPNRQYKITFSTLEDF